MPALSALCLTVFYGVYCVWVSCSTVFYGDYGACKRYTVQGSMIETSFPLRLTEDSCMLKFEGTCLRLVRFSMEFCVLFAFSSVLPLGVSAFAVPGMSLSRPVQHRNWCFTCNNYSLEDEALFRALEYAYLVYGREIGDSGTPHLQGYVQFLRKLRLTALKKLHRTCHWEVAKGTAKENFDYCSKDGDYFESGVAVSVFGGKPTMAERALRNRRLFEAPLSELVFSGEVSIKETRALKNARLDIRDELSLLGSCCTLDGPTPNFWYWGPTGTGKSLKARSENLGAYLKTCNKWWDGYAGEEVVIIEDFDESHVCLAHHMKIWADRYPFPAEVKNSMLRIRPKVIIVTSNVAPSDIWCKANDLLPIERRFTVVRFPIESVSVLPTAFVPGFEL